MTDDSRTAALVDDAALGDSSAEAALFDRCGQRLRRMVAFRMDARLQRRVDPDDVVQEALTVASRRLDEYAQHRPVPFYLWLRQIAWEQLVKIQKRHIWAQKRSTARECELDGALSAQSRGKLADCLASLTTPSRILMRREVRARILEQLEQLPPHFREALVQRYLEQLSVQEIAAMTGISSSAAQMRIVRALQQLRALLDDKLAASDLPK